MRRAKGWYWRLGGVLLITVFMSGCPKKTPPPSETGPGGDFGSGGLREGNLPSPGDTTREKLQPGPEAAGPLRDIHFAYDAFELSSEARETLRSNSDWLKSNSQTKVEVEGHCDDRGTAEYNLALGAKRAKAARDYLISLGISVERLSTISYGEELPLCHEASESCWEQNRRAHFLVLNR